MKTKRSYEAPRDRVTKLLTEQNVQLADFERIIVVNKKRNIYEGLEPYCVTRG